MNLSKDQISIIEAPVETSIFLSGPAGTGKTTAGINRLNYLVQNDVPGRDILLFFPQRNLSVNYLDSLNSLSFPSTSMPTTATFGGLARRSIELFWPILEEKYSQFDNKTQPVFLTLESSLFFLARLIEPLILDQGYFSSITIQRNRLYSQILDNLNKAAIHGFSHGEISERLLSSWIGDENQKIVFEHAQNAANIFREYCYANNLLDYSLQVELFSKALAEVPLVSDHFSNQFRHLIYDNAEEDVPVSHDFIGKLLPTLQSSLIIFDRDAGYRVFLGASPVTGFELSQFCERKVEFLDPFTFTTSLQGFQSSLSGALRKEPPVLSNFPTGLTDVFSIHFESSYPQMVAEVAFQIQSLVDRGVAPEEIVVLAPYLSDSLRFLLTSALDKLSIPSFTHRPSRALRDEPATHCLLTLSALAHPGWNIKPSVYEIATALFQAIDNLDLARAHILSKQGARLAKPPLPLANFESFSNDYKNRSTYYFGSKYQEILDWLNEYIDQSPEPLDHFLIRLFGELLSQKGFGFYNDYNKAQISSQIIESIQKFRQSSGEVLAFSQEELGAEYFKMVKTGVLANQFLQTWTDKSTNAVFLAPAYTFLLNNRPVEYQFWLDVGSRGWYERIYQPLTNPHVLHRNWHIGTPWRDAEELSLNLENLSCITTGLIRRCKKKIYCFLTDLDERGYEQKGLLVQALNSVNNLSHETAPTLEITNHD